ncbi:MAG: NAD(P)/FAD-dependent oxidoreductase [Paracoccaceae bacterium]
MADPKIVIIGAGMAGVACARTLADAGLVPMVIDKGRSPGGRMSTRRTDGFTFDHGAQYFTARSDAFRAVVEDALDAGAVAVWDDGSGADEPHYIGLPSMSAPVKHMANGLDIRCGIEVRAVRSDGTGWVLEHDGGSLGADVVILTAPVPQTKNLLGAHGFADPLDQVHMAPCWALMLGFEASVDPGWTARRTDSDLAWIARNGTKPGRAGESWVVHASPAWSAAHLELDKPEAADRLFAMLQTDLGPLPAPSYIAAHRWRYAMVTTPLGRSFLNKGTLYAGGDWALGPRVECAFESGQAIANAVLNESDI